MAEENNSDKLKGRRNDYKKVFETEEGKKVLKDLEKVCMYRSTTFDKDALVMAFQEGLRAVYLHITTVMDMDIEELEKISKAMTRET
jgi:hypothetical protein